MASVLAGFRPVKHLNGAPYNGQFNRYYCPAGESVALNIGDLVVLSDSASVEAPEGGVYPAVERLAATSGVIVGAVVGFEPDYGNLAASQYRAGSTARVVYVADSPDLIFRAPQDEAGAGAITAAEVGLNAPVVVGAASTTAPYATTMSVDSTVTTTNTLPLQVVGIVASPDNVAADTSRAAEVLVRINTHAFRVATGTTGV